MNGHASSERRTRVRSILLHALDLAENERAAYLDQACSGDSSLRREVEALLVEQGEAADTDPTIAIQDATELTAPGATDPATHEVTAGVPEGPIPKLLAGRYRIDAYLAEGGMGRVYKAHDLELDVPIALKTIHPRIAASPFHLRLFKQEVLLARSITHPNVCRIFEMGRDEDSGTAFLTMEFLEGDTLTSRIRATGRLDVVRSLDIVRNMADALDAAHRAGIVHRDFKSANVMLVPESVGSGRDLLSGNEDRNQAGNDRGEGSANGKGEARGNGDGARHRAVITDFGLAVSVGDEDEEEGAGSANPSQQTSPTTSPPGSPPPVDVTADLTTAAEPPRPGMRRIVGTPAYMAPEQVTGGRVGPPADIYAFGVVLFEMCTGQLPFQEATPIDTAHAHVTSPPPRPSTMATLDETWENAILRLLSKDPGDRFSTANQAVLAIEGRANGETPVRHSLPPERDVFVGRVEELQRLADALEAEPDAESDAPSPTRLVTVLGLGGTGKSRLVQKYGWNSLLRWPGGVWFCDLTEASGPEGIATAVSSALDVSLGRQDPVVQIGNAIAGRGRCLLVLDNFEQAVDCAEATVGRWLAHATEARFLVTSRARLRIPGESAHELEPLDPATRGVELFEARAWGHRPGFTVDGSNRALIAHIVERLDGLPLAIEMAASRMRQLSADQLEQGLGDRFQLLTGTKDGRHATMEATLDWSWDLLETWEQSAVIQASVFEGGFTLEAAEAVIDLTAHVAVPTVLDVIQSLVDKSWIRAAVAMGAPRFSMYATVQEYASAKLRGDTKDLEKILPETSLTDTEARHGVFFASMGTEDAIDRLTRHGGTERRAALHLELDNLMAACRRSIVRSDEEVIVATYAAASAVLSARGPFLPSIELGRDALDVLTDSRRRARALRVMAASERVAGMTDDARAHFETAITIHRELGDRSSEGTSLRDLGDIHAETGRLTEAWEHGEAALAIHREVGDRHGEGRALGGFGNLHMQAGRVDEARSCYLEALAIHREHGDRRSQGVVLGNLGVLHDRMGRTEEARAYYDEALVIYRELGIRHGEGHVLGNLGTVALDQGRIKEARDYFEAALAIHREVGERRFEGIALSNLAIYHSTEGRNEEARRHYAMALAIYREVGFRQGEGHVLANLGAIASSEGALEEASDDFESALVILREQQDRRFEGIVLGNLGGLRQKQGRKEEAGEQFEAAIAILQEVKVPRQEAIVLRSLGSLHEEEGRVAEARSSYETSERLLREVDELIELGSTLCARGVMEWKTGATETAREKLREAEELAVRAEAEPESPFGSEVAAFRRLVEDGA